MFWVRKNAREKNTKYNHFGGYIFVYLPIIRNKVYSPDDLEITRFVCIYTFLVMSALYDDDVDDTYDGHPFIANDSWVYPKTRSKTNNCSIIHFENTNNCV